MCNGLDVGMKKGSMSVSDEAFVFFLFKKIDLPVDWNYDNHLLMTLLASFYLLVYIFI